MDVNTSVAVVDSSLDPRDAIEFDSHEAAYEYYKKYAKSVGFGTAKLSSRRSRASKEFIDAKFSCIRYGNKQQSDDAINPRPTPKIGCKASMNVKRRPDGKWYVHSFVKEHNHELLPAQAHFFRSHRSAHSVGNDSKSRKKNKGPAFALKQFSLENLIRNQDERGRYLELEEGGAEIVLDFFARMQEENPRFFYAVDFNEESRLRNIFWVDGKGIEDLKYFGDVVSLDTTYYSNNCKIPLVVFIGVNHHIQPTLLGCGLIADDTIYTFVWLMKSFSSAMGGRSPKVLLTAQNEDIRAARTLVFPETRHFFHLWHVLEMVPKRLDCRGIWHDSFLKKFNKCINRSCGEEKFEKRWWKLLQRFNLQEDEWFQLLYTDRKLWVPALIRDVSFAGLYVDSRSGSLNAFLDKYINGETTLRDLIGQYNSILQDRHEEEAKANFDAWHETPDLKSPSPFEKEMLLVYTHEIFKKFQMEVLGASACHLKKEDGPNVLYSVKDFESNQSYKVEWDESKSDIFCSCRSFEYKGYLCRHAIVVLQMSGVFNIPYKYILQRWTNAATSRVPLSEKLDEVQAKIRRYNDLCRRAIVLGEEGSLSLDSYNDAVEAIHLALKECEKVNSPSDIDNRPSISKLLNIHSTTGMNHVGSISREQISKSRVTCTAKGSKRANFGKELEDNDIAPSKKGKVPSEPQVSNAGAQGILQQGRMSGTLQYSTLYPRLLTTLLESAEMSKRSVEMLGEMLEEDP